MAADALGKVLAAGGLDITRAFDVRWYNAYVRDEGLPLTPLPDFDREGGSALGILVGNSAALWPQFLRWLGAQPDAGRMMDDPLDKYTRTLIEQVTPPLAAPKERG